MNRLVNLLSGIVFALIPLSGQPGDLYRITGMVTNAATGSPIGGTRVNILPMGSTQVVASQITDGNGRFSFELIQGNYHLEAMNRDLVEPYGLRGPDSRVATSIITGPGKDTTNLVFRWFPLGVISGKIVDEAGEPAERILVQLVRSVITAGRRSWVTAGWAWTDDRGEYRFGAIPGGTYLLAATGTPWYARAQPGPFVDRSIAPPVAYSPVYYPSTTNISQAAPLRLAAGKEVRADFNLSVVRGANVIVKHDAPAGLTGRIALISEGGLGGVDGFQRQENFNGSHTPFVFTAIPPGRYMVRITGSEGVTDFAATRTVEVSGSDVSVELEVHRVPTVSGKVKLGNPDGKPRGSLLVGLVREDTGGAISTAVKPDGTFLFPSVAVAKYRPAIRGTTGYFATQIQVEGTHYNDGVMDLREGESVTMTLVASDETGRLRGFVMQDEKPISGAMVVLAPILAGSDTLKYRGFQTDSDGSFDLQNVVAGDYDLFAVDFDIEYGNPAAVRPFLSNARRVHIEPHGDASERIGISSEAQQ